MVSKMYEQEIEVFIAVTIYDKDKATRRESMVRLPNGLGCVIDANVLMDRLKYLAETNFESEKAE